MTRSPWYCDSEPPPWSSRSEPPFRRRPPAGALGAFPAAAPARTPTPGLGRPLPRLGCTLAGRLPVVTTVVIAGGSGRTLETLFGGFEGDVLDGCRPVGRAIVGRRSLLFLLSPIRGARLRSRRPVTTVAGPQLQTSTDSLSRRHLRPLRESPGPSEPFAAAVLRRGRGSVPFTLLWLHPRPRHRPPARSESMMSAFLLREFVCKRHRLGDRP